MQAYLKGDHKINFKKVSVRFINEVLDLRTTDLKGVWCTPLIPIACEGSMFSHRGRPRLRSTSVSPSPRLVGRFDYTNHFSTTQS